MALEIERRFLVKNNAWQKASSTEQHFTQGYISISDDRTVRVRIADNEATLNIKVAINTISRHEFEYPISIDEANELLKHACLWILEKTRYFINHQDNCFEVDVFMGDNAGLILAEIELPREDTPFDQPDWLGEEVTHDPRFTTAYLSQHSFKTWNNHHESK